MKNILSKQKIPFTMVCNQLIFDSRVSSKAKFYYVYLSSKPEGWEFHTNAIMKEIKEGKDAFYSGLIELEEFGYLHRLQKRAGGKFSFTEYNLLIPDNTDYIPYTENPDTTNPYTENPDDNNIYSNKNNVNKKDCIALQGQSNFSKNDIKENPTPEILPNRTNSGEEKDFTLESFKEFYQFTLLRDEPHIGFEKEYSKCYHFWHNRTSPDTKRNKYNNDWRNHVREWSERDYNIKPKQPTEATFAIAPESSPPNPLCVEITINNPDIKKLNELLTDALMVHGEAMYYSLLKGCFIISYELDENSKSLKVELLTSPPKRQNIERHFENIKQGVKTSFKKFWQKERLDLEVEVNLQIPTQEDCKGVKLIYENV